MFQPSSPGVDQERVTSPVSLSHSPAKSVIAAGGPKSQLVLLPESVELRATMVSPPEALESRTSTPETSWVPERFKYHVAPFKVERNVIFSKLR